MSGVGKLSFADIVKTLLVGTLGAAVSGGIAALQFGGFNWQAVGVGALTAGLSYLLKQLGTDSRGKAFGIEATAPK